MDPNHTCANYISLQKKAAKPISRGLIIEYMKIEKRPETEPCGTMKMQTGLRPNGIKTYLI